MEQHKFAGKLYHVNVILSTASATRRGATAFYRKDANDVVVVVVSPPPTPPLGVITDVITLTAEDKGHGSVSSVGFQLLNIAQSHRTFSVLCQ